MQVSKLYDGGKNTKELRGNNVKHIGPETVPIPNSHSLRPHNSRSTAYNNQEGLASLLWNS